jgi:signal transduction histidine kinase
MGSRLNLSVEDSGYGISEQVQEKIMQPFFTTKEVGQGTGLGLSISKSLAEDHGGNLYYDQSSRHTRFVLELPLCLLEATSISDPSPSNIFPANNLTSEILEES